MQRPIRMLHLFFAALASALLVAGCTSTPSAGARQPLHAEPQPPSDRDAAARREAEASAGQVTQAEMNQMFARLRALETDNAQLKKKLSDQYMEAVELRRKQIEAEKAGGPTPKPNTSATADTPEKPGEPQATNTPKPADLSKLSRLDLLDALVAQILEGEDPDRVKALMAAAISVASESHELDPRLLDPLDPRSREQVARFHQMLAVVYDQLARDNKKALSRSEMIEQIDKVFGDQPLTIQTLEICRRVGGYGVFDPFDTTRFLAGQKNRVLVYVELENFKHEPTDDGRYEVKLEQQVELYDATGETMVWRQGPVELVDVSRNQRRDFFIVYPVDLPARLPAGGYRLKVRIADKHTGSICEQTMHNIQIVADKALVGGER